MPPSVKLGPAGADGVGRTAAPAAAATAGPRYADFDADPASPPPSADVRHVADWVADSGDHAGLGFVIVDKQHAMVHVFDAQARRVAASPALLGSARADHTVPGIGQRPLEQVLPEERTTPAGRFVAERGRNTLGEDVVWVDYDAAVSIHRVRTTTPSERRLQRLASPTIDDNRISYGCINVPVAFFEAHVAPLFASHRAVVYVLPEVWPVQAVFGSHDVRARQALASELTHVDRTFPRLAIDRRR
ncbi:MAG: hypothetical protein AD742_08160 [Methylibium sp. NZG]|nr:MAG: hypothetical protein AD742_08160 [Methylibium sp. NZG]